MERNQILHSPIFVALISGIFAITGINNISRLLGLLGGFGILFVALVAFFVMGMALAKFAHKTTGKFPLVVFSFPGILLGVIINAEFDYFIRHHENNLFFIEIIIYWIMAPLPLLVGILFQRAREKYIKCDKS